MVKQSRPVVLYPPWPFMTHALRVLVGATFLGVCVLFVVAVLTGTLWQALGTIAIYAWAVGTCWVFGWLIMKLVWRV